jgi:hypothetical protein
MYRDSFKRNWLLNKKVKVQFSAPNHHQGNGIAERTVRKLLDLARTLMIEANAPLAATDMFIEFAGWWWWLNKLPNSKTGDKTPYEIITGRKPDLSYCVPASSTAYVLHTKEEPGRVHKMSPKADEARLIGYPEDCEGFYRLLTNNGKLIVRRDVRFNDFEQPKELSKRDLDILYNEEEWCKYVHSIEDDKNQFFTEEDELINITIEDKDELFKIKYDSTSSDEQQKNETDETANANVSQIEEAIVEEKETSDNLTLDTKSSIREQQINNDNEILRKENKDRYIRVTRSKSKQVNGIHYVLRKDEDNIRSIVTPQDCTEALDENNPYRNEWLKAINKEIEAVLNIKVFETISTEEARNK